MFNKGLVNRREHIKIIRTLDIDETT